MKFKKRTPITTGVNLTSLIDIVFLLLIFFMLTAHFVNEEAINVELPTSEYATEINENKPIVVVVTKNGELSIDAKVISREKFFSAVASLVSSGDKKVLYIKGDKKAKLSDIVYVMDAAKASNIASVSIESE
ncbi:MAG: hypothetical protein COB42_04310 [Sulfurimonas sp.]|nr:MAG: hypothetical protein COB42_04310 [Sulfurimonas sp.]